MLLCLPYDFPYYQGRRACLKGTTPVFFTALSMEWNDGKLSYIKKLPIDEAKTYDIESPTQ